MEGFEVHLKTECVNFKVDPMRMTVKKLKTELKRRGESTKVEYKTILAERLQRKLDEDKRKESEASSLGFFTHQTHRS